MVYYQGRKEVGGKHSAFPKVSEDPSANAMVCEAAVGLPPPLSPQPRGLLKADLVPSWLFSPWLAPACSWIPTHLEALLVTLQGPDQTEPELPTAGYPACLTSQTGRVAEFLRVLEHSGGPKEKDVRSL